LIDLGVDDWDIFPPHWRQCVDFIHLNYAEDLQQPKFGNDIYRAEDVPGIVQPRPVVVMDWCLDPEVVFSKRIYH
jgi:hypothetical protein